MVGILMYFSRKSATFGKKCSESRAFWALPPGKMALKCPEAWAPGQKMRPSPKMTRILGICGHYAEQNAECAENAHIPWRFWPCSWAKCRFWQKCSESWERMASPTGKMMPMPKMPSRLGAHGLAPGQNATRAKMPRIPGDFGLVPGKNAAFGENAQRPGVFRPRPQANWCFRRAAPLVIPGAALQATFREKRTTIGSCIFGKMLLRDHPGNYGQNRAIERRL